MAIIHSNSIFGTASGKMGDVIFSTWKGKQYVRAKSMKVFNPRTPRQLEQREKFGAIQKFLKPLTPILRIGFKSQTAKMSAFNAAMSYNFKNALTGTFPDFAIDYSMALVSRGPLTGALNPKVSQTTAGEIEFAWEDNSNDNHSMPNDRVMLVVYSHLSQQAEFLIGSHMRRDGYQVIVLPESFSGNEVQCYLAFQNINQRLVSNSQFVGSLIVS